MQMEYGSTAVQYTTVEDYAYLGVTLDAYNRIVPS